jgi:hypothetical protein
MQTMACDLYLFIGVQICVPMPWYSTSQVLCAAGHLLLHSSLNDLTVHAAQLRPSPLLQD